MSQKILSKSAAGEQHAALGMTSTDISRPISHPKHPESQWFPNAGLGLFVHWGIASVHGALDLSWAMIANTPYDSAALGRNKLSPNEYWSLADRFHPNRYDPRQWIAAAKAAGFTYAVFTTMHHDGYTLWPSAYGDFGVQSHFGGKDLVRPFVEACREFGLKIGLYYSPMDWRFDRKVMSFNYRSGQPGEFADRPHFDSDHKPCVLEVESPAHIARRREIFHGRVTELLTRYGHIDLLWLDGGAHDNELRDLARNLQPHILVNNRSCDGDFNHTECHLPEVRPSGWFETCHCWQASDVSAAHDGYVDFWGYLREEEYKSTAWMLDCLVRLRAWDANFLINVGPRPDGELPPVVYERLAETAQWMMHSGKSVIGVRGGPYPERCNVPVTAAGDTLYLHATPGFNELMTLHAAARPRAVMLLRTGEPLPYVYRDSGELAVEVPKALRTQLVDVVAVHYSSDIGATANRFDLAAA